MGENIQALIAALQLENPALAAAFTEALADKSVSEPHPRTLAPWYAISYRADTVNEDGTHAKGDVYSHAQMTPEELANVPAHLIAVPNPQGQPKTKDDAAAIQTIVLAAIKKED